MALNGQAAGGLTKAIAATAAKRTLADAVTVVDVTEVVRHGEKLTLPEGMSLDGAIDLLTRRKDYENKDTAFKSDYDVMPWDGANALNEVLRAKYGWAQATATPGFFGDTPPRMVSVEVAPGVFKEVPWGRFNLPNVTGWVQTGTSVSGNRIGFALHAHVLRKDEIAVRSLFEDVRQFLKTGSIYRGQAIKLRFKNDDGSPMELPEPKFIDTSKIDPEGLVYSADVMAAVETNLFTPVRRVKDCLANGIPVKRGILLGGTYGTGKTLAATVAARLAVDAGITYVYVPRADELGQAIEFAKQYQSPACVVFCEDVDRVTSGERDQHMDDILNMLDGLDTKTANIITVLTTNDMNAINAAMLRPGRLDAVIDVTAPDGPAVEKLLRLYAAGTVAPTTDLSKVGDLLAGNIPAIIAEVVKRAKLAQLRFQKPGEPIQLISEDAFIAAAKSMNMQIKLLKDRSAQQPPPPSVDSTLRGMLTELLDKSATEIVRGVDAL